MKHVWRQVKKLIFIIAMLSVSAWAVPTRRRPEPRPLPERDRERDRPRRSSERLSVEDEATIAACNFVKRDLKAFSENYNDDTAANPEEALLGDWLRWPSQDF